MRLKQQCGPHIPSIISPQILQKQAPEQGCYQFLCPLNLCPHQCQNDPSKIQIGSLLCLKFSNSSLHLKWNPIVLRWPMNLSDLPLPVSLFSTCARCFSCFEALDHTHVSALPLLLVRLPCFSWFTWTCSFRLRSLLTSSQNLPLNPPSFLWVTVVSVPFI